MVTTPICWSAPAPAGTDADAFPCPVEPWLFGYWPVGSLPNGTVPGRPAEPVLPEPVLPEPVLPELVPPPSGSPAATSVPAALAATAVPVVVVVPIPPTLAPTPTNAATASAPPTTRPRKRRGCLTGAAEIGSVDPGAPGMPLFVVMLVLSGCCGRRLSQAREVGDALCVPFEKPP